MIIKQKISDTLVKSYSDRGMMIFGGFPEGLYSEAIDPIDMHREYIETNIPIETEDNMENPIEEEEIEEIIEEE